MPATDSFAPQNEADLWALPRKRLQALAKKENVRPANAASHVLIKRLLLIFFPAPSIGPAPVKAVSPKPTSPQPKPEVTTPTLPRVNTKVVAAPPPLVAAARGPNNENARIPLNLAPRAPPPVAGPSKLRTRPVAQEILRVGNKLLYQGHATHPSHPNQPFLCPTRSYIRTLQSKLDKLDATFHDIPSLSTMERVLERAEGTTSTVADAVKACSWNGYYLQTNILQHMKVDPTLYDGTNGMPPGPAKDKWLGFLQEVEKENQRQEAEERRKRNENGEGSTETDSGHSSKRQREDDDEESSQSSKRRRARSLSSEL
ncbi:hypothetical protein C8R46DRAFT_1341357 [Mycena filopes]|nr:hypothetical protein C8R46DRAFT_1341357 [Mycena filopes]